MLDRTEFLSTGLVPTEPTTGDCGICLCDLTEPVKLPCRCGTIFDINCIKKWLSTPRRNTCPICKTELFALPEDEDANAGQDRRALVAEAIRSSQVATPEALERVQKFGVDTTTIPRSQWQRATAHAAHVLGQTYRVPMPSSPAVIRTKVIAANFVAMANLIPAFARAQGRVYDLQEAVDWETVLMALWNILGHRNNKTVDAANLAAKLRAETKDSLEHLFRKDDVHVLAPLFTYSDPSIPNPHYDDLELMLSYLAQCCWRTRREEDELAAKEKENAAVKRRAQVQKTKESCAIM